MRWLVLIATLTATPVWADGYSRGAALAARNCGMCHAIGRVGASRDPQAPPFRELGGRYGIDELAEALSNGLISGHPAMPAFRFTPAEVNDLIQYLRSIQSREAAFANSDGAH